MSTVCKKSNIKLAKDNVLCFKLGFVSRQKSSILSTSFIK